MKAFAPGKVVLTGAYAVLEGAPAIAAAVSRGVVADSSRPAQRVTDEVAAAGMNAPPSFDASQLFDGSRKLGLGASAAILVASLATEESDPSDPSARARIFSRARAAHAKAQQGGSGVDIACAVHGGVIQYVIDRPVTPVILPKDTIVKVFSSSTSARTSDLRAAVDRLPEGRRRDCMNDLAMIARDAVTALGNATAAAFVEAVRRAARSLARLGDAAGVGIVPPGFSDLEAIAARADAAFCVSGAGGGDVSFWIGPSSPSHAFLESASRLGLTPLDLSFVQEGVKKAL